MQIFLITWKKLTRKTHLQNQSSVSNQGGKLQTVSLTRVSLQKLPGSFLFLFYLLLFVLKVNAVHFQHMWSLILPFVEYLFPQTS